MSSGVETGDEHRFEGPFFFAKHVASKVVSVQLEVQLEAELELELYVEMAEMQTMCFHTHDAIEQHDSTFTFAVAPSRNKMSTAKVALASCEFPMMQWTIESDWCKLWLNEGVRLDSSNNFIDVVTRTSNGCECVAPLRLCVPPRLNRVVSVTRDCTGFRVHCATEHGLLGLVTSGSGRSVIKSFKIIGGRRGDLVVDVADVVVLDATVFRITVERGAATAASYDDDALKYVLMPTIPTPSDLCDMLSACAQRLLQESVHEDQDQALQPRAHWPDVIVRLTFTYDVVNDLIQAAVVVAQRGTVVRILPSTLARLCGFSTMPLRLASTTGTWPSEPTLFWDFVELPTGFYGPCHRPMCVGKPLGFCPEVEAAVNRLYFPLPAAAAAAAQAGPGAAAHLFIFAEPGGHVLSCTVPPGRYSPSSLCRHLEHSMLQSTLAVDPLVSFTVQYNDDCRYVFSCTRRRKNGKYVAATFSMLFNHSMSIDASRIGFPQQPLCGSSTYVSAVPVSYTHLTLPTKRIV